MRDSDDPLLELATDIAEGRAVRWEEVRQDHPELASRLESLHQIEGLVRDFAHLMSPQEETTAAPPSSESWGHLRLVDSIAEGSFGEVWRAFDPVLQREVALKLRREGTVGDASARAFIDEARRLAKVRHPNILGVHGADIHDGRVGLWTDLLESRTLEQEIESGADLPFDRQLEIAGDLTSALAAVHAAGLVHGDVKGSNVALEADGRAVLLDFGAGVDLASSAHDGGSYGSPLSSPPERLEGAPLEPSTDLWGLGVLLYRLAAGGRYPFEAADVRGLKRVHEERDSAPIARDLGGVPRAYRALLDRLLDPRPEARPDAAGVAVELERIASAPARRRRRLAVTAIVGSLAIGLLAAATGYVRATHSAEVAEAARRDAEEVTQFLREVLVAPRLTEGGHRVLVTEVLEAAEHQVESNLEPGSPVRARIWELLGGTYLSLDRYADAEPVLRRAIEELDDLYGPQHPLAINARIRLAEALFETGREEEGERLMARAAEGAEALPAGHHVLAWLRVTQAKRLMAQARLDEAESLLLGEWRTGWDRAQIGNSVRHSLAINLAEVRRRQGRLAEAVALLEPLARDLEETRGPRHTNTFVAWNNLASLLGDLNRRQEALPYLERVAEEAAAWLGEEHWWVLMARANLAGMLRELGRPEEALLIFHELVPRMTAVFGPDDVRTLQVENNLALALKAVGDSASAERRLEEVAGRARESVGPDHPLAYIVAVNRAEVRLDSARPLEAREILEPVRRRMAEGLGDEHLFVLAADSVLGAARAAAGESEQGIAILRRTLQAQRELAGETDHQSLLTQIRLGGALAQAGESAEARALLEQALAWCRAVFSERHEGTLAARAALERLDSLDQPTTDRSAGS